MNKDTIKSGFFVTLVHLTSARAFFLLTGVLLCISAIYFYSPNPNLQGILMSILTRSMPLVIVSIGLSLVIAAADIDLSSAGVISAGSMLLAFFAIYEVHWLAAWSAVLLLGAASGFSQGWLVARWNVSALVLTLGTSFSLLGAATVGAVFLQKFALENPGISPRTVPEVYRVGRVVTGEVLVLLLLAVLTFWRFGTLSGVRHLAVGLDRGAAANAALPVRKIRIRSFLVAGLGASLASLFLVDYLGGGAGPRIGLGYELLAIASCVIGGVQISGGYLRPVEVVLAAVLVRAIDESARALPFVPSEMYLLVIGLLVAVVAALDGVRAKSNRVNE